MSQFLRTSAMKMSVVAALALALSAGLLGLSGAPAHAQTVAAPATHAAMVVKHQVATSQRSNWRGDYRHHRRYGNGYGYGGYGYGGYGFGGYGYGYGGYGYGGYDGYGYGCYNYCGYGYGNYGYDGYGYGYGDYGY